MPLGILMLKQSAFLASAAATTELQAQIISLSMSIISDKSFDSTLSTWSEKSQEPIQIADAARVFVRK